MDRIAPTSDLAFKKVLASEENKDILAGLIWDFFEVKAEDIVIEKPYSIAICKELVENYEVAKLRQTLKDVAASFKAADFVSEVQVRKALYYEERSLYYPFERFVQNYSKAGEIKTDEDGNPIRYSTLRPVYSLNILDHSLFGEDKDALRIFELYDPKRGKRFKKDLLRIGFFELTKGNIETANQRHWRKYFKSGKADEGAPPYIKKASKIVEYINLNEEERFVISAMERLEANDEAERAYYIAESRAKGREQGMAEGERKKAIEMAKKMMLKNKPVNEIMEFTELSEDEIKKIVL